MYNTLIKAQMSEGNIRGGGKYGRVVIIFVLKNVVE